jgi:hypothetical protein
MTKTPDGALVGQAGHANIKLGELAVQRHIVQGLFHGWSVQAKPLQYEVNAQHGVYYKGRTAHLARRRVRRDLRRKLCQQHYQVHLVKKLAPTRAFGGYRESGSGETYLLPTDLTYEQLTWITHAPAFHDLFKISSAEINIKISLDFISIMSLRYCLK